VRAAQLAHAKLTVYLHITGRRDDGYHLLDSEMVSLDLADTLEFTDGDGLEVVGYADVPTDDSNLVVRSMRLAGVRAHVRLIKDIPPGAGLGGGSSDAAAVLRWAGVDVASLGPKLGADVPFCVMGGRGRVTGIGEVVEPLEFEERSYTLLMPPFGVNTAAVYRAFDEQRPGGIDWSDRNHLQDAALAVEPRLRYWRDLLKEITGSEAVLAGSGSTWFAEGEWRAPPQDVLGEARWIVAKTVR